MSVSNTQLLQVVAEESKKEFSNGYTHQDVPDEEFLPAVVRVQQRTADRLQELGDTEVVALRTVLTNTVVLAALTNFQSLSDELDGKD